MADPVYQDQPYMRKSFLFFSDVYLTGAVQNFRRAFAFLPPQTRNDGDGTDDVDPEGMDLAFQQDRGVI